MPLPVRLTWLDWRLDWRNNVFSIRLFSGEEVQASEGDELEINQQTGVLSVSRVDGFEEITTHYSPSAWASVTHRKKGRRDQTLAQVVDRLTPI